MSVKNVIWKLLSGLSSLRFSIMLLLLLASISVVGTLIEQDQSLAYYQFNYPESKPVLLLITWKQILALGLDHVYSNYFFVVLLLLFFLSLLLCTFSTQLPILKHARQWNFIYSQTSLKRKFCYNQSNSNSLINFVYVLNLNSYYVFHKGSAIYSYKGLLGRIAPIFVHLGIIFTLVGSLFGFMGGFVVQEMVPNGEVFHIQNTIKYGPYSIIPYNVLGRVNDFFVLFNNDQSIKQFFSNISILNHQGHVVFSKLVAVNSPLKFKGVTFYQTDWRVNALRVQIGTAELLTRVLQESPNNSLGHRVWVSNLIIGKDHKVSIVIPDLESRVLIYDDTAKLITQTEYGSWNVIYGVPIVFKDLMLSTGLQIKVDPGLYIAYSAFLVLMISIVVSYVSYSQIWANQCKQCIDFSGSTNRAFLSFEDEVVQIYQKYRSLSRFLD